MSNDMRGLFFIVKGQYTRRSGKSFVNRATGDTSYIGGYDPFSEDTEEWYMLLDTRTYNCVMCGTRLDKIVRGVYTIIKKHRGDAKRYFKCVEDTSKGYPKVSPAMRCLYEEVYNEFGDYYSDEIEEMEDLAYRELAEESPLVKSRKVLTKSSLTPKEVKETPQEVNTTTLTVLKPKKMRIGFKKI